MTIMWNWQVGLRMVSVGRHLSMIMIILRMEDEDGGDEDDNGGQ